MMVTGWWGMAVAAMEQVTSLHICTDTQKLADYCQLLGEQGVSEATAVPIVD